MHLKAQDRPTIHGRNRTLATTHHPPPTTHRPTTAWTPLAQAFLIAARRQEMSEGDPSGPRFTASGDTEIAYLERHPWRSARVSKYIGLVRTFNVLRGKVLALVFVCPNDATAMILANDAGLQGSGQLAPDTRARAVPARAPVPTPPPPPASAPPCRPG
jgi:hypothetical protein